MLVLSRKLNESIRIGDQVTITVVSVGPNRVRLGIQAPHSTRVLRQELTFDIEDFSRSGKAETGIGLAVVDG